jgi:hypothetical protein
VTPRGRRRPALVGPVLAWAFVLGLLPRFVEGAPLPPVGRPAAEASIGALEWRLAAARLEALGVSPEEAAARLARLSAEERGLLAARLDEVAAGGDPAAAVIAIAIIIGLLAVIVLELMGRRVISRP